MNRKSFISTLLGGIGLGIAAKEVIAADLELAPAYGVTGGGELITEFEAKQAYGLNTLYSPTPYEGMIIHWPDIRSSKMIYMKFINGEFREVRLDA